MTESSENQRVNQIKDALEHKIGQLERQIAETRSTSKKFEETCARQKKDMTEMEAMFNELKKRYNNSKEMNAELKKKEEILKGELAITEKRNQELTHKHESFIVYAEDKIQKANEEIAHQKKVSTGIIEATAAKNKQLEIKVALLESQLESKQSEIDRIDKVMAEFFKPDTSSSVTLKPLVS